MRVQPSPIKSSPGPGPAIGPGPHGDSPELVGYMRVSTHSQKDDTQLADLTAAGCARIFRDHGVSGKLAKRPGLDEAVAYLQPGDTFVITRLSRAMRSLHHLLNLAASFRERGIGLKVLKQDIDTTTPHGRLVFNILGAVDEWQRELIVEGTNEGLAAARANGKTFGHPRALTAEQEEHAIELIRSGRSVAEVSRSMNVSRAALYRMFERRGLTEPVGDDGRQRRNAVTADQAAEIMRMLRAGDNYSAVSRATGRSLATVKRVWNDSGERRDPPGHGRIQATGTGGKPSALDDEQRRQLKVMLEDSQQVAHIAKRFGVSRATIYREMTKLAEQAREALATGAE